MATKAGLGKDRANVAIEIHFAGRIQSRLSALRLRDRAKETENQAHRRAQSPPQPPTRDRSVTSHSLILPLTRLRGRLASREAVGGWGGGACQVRPKAFAIVD